MTLTTADVARLEAAGRGGFVNQDQEGYLRLRNVEGRCVFLHGGSCAVYPHRPEGCVLYPLIYYCDCGEAGLDEFCPHGNEFRFAEGDREWLCRSVELEEREAEARRRAPAQEQPGPTGRNRS